MKNTSSSSAAEVGMGAAAAAAGQAPPSGHPGLQVKRETIRPQDVVIGIMGVTGVGKSTFISLFTDQPISIGDDLQSCTGKVDIYVCEKFRGRGDQRLFLIDTPGFDDSDQNRSDSDILKEIAAWLAEAYQQKIQLSGLIYLHRIMDVRLGGTAMKNLRMFKELCGQNGLENVVLATTMWGLVDSATAVRREAQLITDERFWAGMIALGSKVFRQDHDVESATSIVKYLALKTPVILEIQREIVDEGKSLDQTAAGKAVDAEIAKVKEDAERQLKALKIEMQEALEEKDKKWQEEIEKTKKETEEKLIKSEQNKAILQIGLDQLKQYVEGEVASRNMNEQTQIREKEYEIQALKQKQEHDNQLYEMRSQHLQQMSQLQQNHSAELHETRMAAQSSSASCVVM